MTKKVAICGTHHDTLKMAPFDNNEWEIWGPAWKYNTKEFPRLDVGFEMHILKQIHNYEGEEYLNWLNKPDIPVFARPDMVSALKGCTAYPMQKAEKLMGRCYFASSFSYMLCKAIMDGYKEIGLYGINLTADEEYFHQRPNAEYLIGLAQGRGIKITIPKASALLSLGYVYGDGAPVGAENPLIAQYQAREEEITQRIRDLNKQYDEIVADIDRKRDQITEDFKKEVNQMLGAQHEMIEIIKALKNTDRGGLRNLDGKEN